MTSKKRCPQCGLDLPLSRFGYHRGRRDGLQAYCLECRHTYNSEWRTKHGVRLRASEAKYRRENREILDARLKKWYQDNRQRAYRVQAEWRARNYEYVKKLWRASLAVGRAVRKGLLTKPSKCSKCRRSDKRIEAHHHRGYAPEHYLDVVWLCTPCHKVADSQLPKKERLT